MTMCMRIVLSVDWSVVGSYATAAVAAGREKKTSMRVIKEIGDFAPDQSTYFQVVPFH